MPRGPKISIVTPCFNSAKTIRETLQSVASQDFRDWEHLVIDGASKDGTLEIINEFPHLKVLSEKDEGHYDAMNKGIARSTGDYIVILNADDCFRPGILGKVAAALEKNPAWDGLFGDVIYVDANSQEIYRRAEAKYDFNVLLYSLDNVCHHTLFVRREVYARIGNYRQKDFRNAADFEFKLRLGRKGCRIGHLPEFIVNYRYHSAGQSADRRITANSEAEAVRVRAEYGNPGGTRGEMLRVVFKIKRQLQKLFIRGSMDIIPGNVKLRSHMMDKAEFSSNSGLDKL
jgi:glycosyltransferase involved in cell wall biosynthesis